MPKTDENQHWFFLMVSPRQSGTGEFVPPLSPKGSDRYQAASALLDASVEIEEKLEMLMTMPFPLNDPAIPAHVARVDDLKRTDEEINALGSKLLNAWGPRARKAAFDLSARETVRAEAFRSAAASGGGHDCAEVARLHEETSAVVKYAASFIPGPKKR